jgi:hypothetical protein
MTTKENKKENIGQRKFNVEIRKSVGPNKYEYINFAADMTIEEAIKAKEILDLACEDLSPKDTESHSTFEIKKELDTELDALEKTPTENLPEEKQIFKCDYCKSTLWDNRDKKAAGQYKETSPDFRCSNKDCGRAGYYNKKDGSIKWWEKR